LSFTFLYSYYRRRSMLLFFLLALHFLLLLEIINLFVNLHFFGV
jgi:hypothetical protein